MGRLARWTGRDAVQTARLVGLAICIGFGLAFIIANVRSWQLEDAQAYWNAAMRLRHGQQLYVPIAGLPEEMIAYRYSPWIAWAWVPLTYLPKAGVDFGWSCVLIASAILAVAPALRNPTPASVALAGLLGGLLVRTASTGNVHALLVATLVWGVRRRTGPLWIGLAASVKIAPIAYVIVYLGRRQWIRALVACAVAAVLWVPALWYGLAQYPAGPGSSLSTLTFVGPIGFGVVALAISLAALRFARTRYAWLASTGALLSWLPRLNYYDLTYLLVGLSAGDASRPIEKAQ
jgi:hypothetical protein